MTRDQILTQILFLGHVPLIIFHSIPLSGASIIFCKQIKLGPCIFLYKATNCIGDCEWTNVPLSPQEREMYWSRLFLPKKLFSEKNISVTMCFLMHLHFLLNSETELELSHLKNWLVLVNTCSGYDIWQKYSQHRKWKVFLQRYISIHSSLLRGG